MTDVSCNFVPLGRLGDSPAGPCESPPFEQEAPAKGRFRPTPWCEIEFRADQEWLVKRVLPLCGVAAIYGESGSFKSFVAMHIALCVALGEPWGGRKTRAAPVVYIAAEGAFGLRKRKAGYLAARSLPEDLPFHLIDAAPNFGRLDGDADALVADIEAARVSPGLIVIDTIAQTLKGADENGEGMSALIANAQRLAQRFKSLVLLVHHVGHGDDAKKRLRGHSSLPAALDASLHCERTPGDLSATLTLRKAKDEEDGGRFALTLARVEIGEDADGDSVSTLIVSDVGEATPAAIGSRQTSQPKAPPPSQRLLMATIASVVHDHGESFSPFGAAGPTVRAASEKAIRDEFYRRIAETIETDDDPKRFANRRRQAFLRGVTDAIKATRIIAADRKGERYLWLA